MDRSDTDCYSKRTLPEGSDQHIVTLLLGINPVTGSQGIQGQNH